MAAAKDRSPQKSSDSAFAQRLRQHRKTLNISQSQLGQLIGVQVQTVSQWERALKRPQPRFYTKLADVLGLADTSDLRRLLEAPAAVATQGRSDHLALVREATDGLERAPEGSNSNLGSVQSSAERVLDSALAIIDARGGRLNTAEVEIVQALMSCYRELRLND